MRLKRAIVSIPGENGAGKTTLIKIIPNLVTPTDGRVWIFGRDNRKAKNELYKYVGALLEGNRNIYRNLYAYQNLQ